MTNETIYTDMVQPRGPGYSSDRIKPWSHYREPIDTGDGRLHGESRRWGDASQQTQSRVIDSLIDASREAGLSTRETAYVLAIARVESGFNPDAAAGTTSASGLGQFIDRTGAHYGVNNANRFDVHTQSQALVQHFIDNRDLARSRGQGEDYIYKYHHDGPSSDYGGLGLSRREVAAYLDRYERFVEQRLGMTQDRAPTQPPAATTARSNFEQAMERMLPGSGSVDPHITGHYGENRGSRGAHGGTDFNYEGGQSGRNLQHPTVHAPIGGVVTFSGGQYGTVKIRDAQGNSHEILHLDSRLVQEGQTVRAGDPIGTMGGRGPNGASQYAQHVHYQMHDANGHRVNPEAWWNQGRQVEVGGERGHAEVLRHGDQNDGVRTLQQQLNQAGFRDAHGHRLAEDGHFGDHTREAVEAAQRRYGLKVDGIAGPLTQGAIGKALSEDKANVERAGAASVAQPARSSRLPLVSEPGHPGHDLYAAIGGKMPPGTAPETIANITLQARENGIADPSQVKQVHVEGSDVTVMSQTPGIFVRVDLGAPTASLERMSEHLREQAQTSAVQTQQQQKQTIQVAASQ